MGGSIRMARSGRVAVPANLARDLVEARFGRAQPPVALIPRDAVQPGSQLAGVLRGAAILSSDSEGLPQDLGGLPGVAQHPAAVSVQGGGVPVERGRQPCRVACLQAREDLAVVHLPP